MRRDATQLRSPAQSDSDKGIQLYAVLCVARLALSCSSSHAQNPLQVLECEIRSALLHIKSDESLARSTTLQDILSFSSELQHYSSGVKMRLIDIVVKGQLRPCRWKL